MYERKINGINRKVQGDSNKLSDINYFNNHNFFIKIIPCISTLVVILFLFVPLCFGTESENIVEDNSVSNEVVYDSDSEPIQNEQLDLTFTNNLIFYLCFMSTLSLIYNMTRNIFHKEYNI